jgi:hypothetical protein
MLLVGVEELDFLIEVMKGICHINTKVANLNPKTHIEAL